MDEVEQDLSYDERKSYAHFPRNFFRPILYSGIYF